MHFIIIRQVCREVKFIFPVDVDGDPKRTA